MEVVLSQEVRCVRISLYLPVIWFFSVVIAVGARLALKAVIELGSRVHHVDLLRQAIGEANG